MGSAETTLNGGSADPMPVCIGDAQINYFYYQFKVLQPILKDPVAETVVYKRKSPCM